MMDAALYQKREEVIGKISYTGKEEKYDNSKSNVYRQLLKSKSKQLKSLIASFSHNSFFIPSNSSSSSRQSLEKSFPLRASDDDDEFGALAERKYKKN